MNGTCPTCEVELVPEGNEKVCPRCSRLFSVALVKAASNDVYRDAPIVDLAPVWREPPPWVGLIVQRNDDVLSVSLRRSAEPYDFENKRAPLGPIAFLAGVLGAIFTVTWGGPMAIPLAAVGLGTIAAIIRELSERETPGYDPSSDETIDLDGNVLRVMARDFGRAAEHKLPLSEIRQFRLDGEILSVEMVDGSEVQIGNVVSMPEAVREWLWKSILSRLPLLPDVAPPRRIDAPRLAWPAGLARIAACPSCAEPILTAQTEVTCPGCGRTFTEPR